MDLVLLSNCVKALLQDETFLTNLIQVKDALEIPAKDWLSLDNRFKNGSITMYVVIRDMLIIWQGRKGSQVELVPDLINILEQEGLQNAADLLKDLLKGFKRPIHMIISTRTNNQLIFDGMQPKRDFDVLARLDVGTFSDVFKVRDTIDNREYAVKRICVGQFLLLTKTSGAADAFHKLVREVVIMKKLPRHENIVTCHDAWFEGPLQQRFTEWLKLSESMAPPISPMNEVSRPQTCVSDDEKNTFMYIKMELMDINLAQWYHQNPDKIGNFETTVTITKQMLASLATIHAEGIIHRDLKPNNILLNRRGKEITVKIGDFGLSREVPAVDSTLSGHVGGAFFSSPEMKRGERDYTFKTDIFSVGLIVLVMLHPFSTEKELERGLDVVRDGDSRILENVVITHPRIYDLLRAMLKRKPENRPTAEEALTVMKIISTK
ncbi:interferon-induced, double-stranded RNA-activated protein kinase [Folsomia candida]|uniref:Putative serine/threonine-protein kinase GCN2 n=1 Tax=Folsomia candida TaxID=158441 RepID=A0A226EL82_FOLCA|nr:interferon-induced, double-stranded RNA-activated protein kinase [Folsomia candida]OXA58219.1 putative serine/threonine-protein kinase GCN2 [Folsomia candida]